MLSIDVSLIVVFFIVWILVAVLTKAFFNPLRKVMGEREAKIQGNRKSTEDTLRTFEEEFHRIEEKLEEARAEAQSLKEKLQQEGFREKEKILEETNRDCRSQVETAKETLEKQISSLKKKLESQSEGLAERIEKRLLI
jgi:F-type H+-transporting ATPase subunit b